MSGIDDIVLAWQKWDSKPGDPATAKALIAEVRKLADALGVSSTTVRKRMSAGRIKGYSREEIIAVIASKDNDS